MPDVYGCVREIGAGDCDRIVGDREMGVRIRRTLSAGNDAEAIHDIDRVVVFTTGRIDYGNM